MKVLIDMVCAECAQPFIDQWVERGGELPFCGCGLRFERLWRTAPGITPQGTRAERGFDRRVESKVDTKAIALDAQREVEGKWLRYSDEKLAEQHVSREINHKAGMADEQGNLTPIPTPPPITFPNPVAAGVAG